MRSFALCTLARERRAFYLADPATFETWTMVTEGALRIMIRERFRDVHPLLTTLQATHDEVTLERDRVVMVLCVPQRERLRAVGYAFGPVHAWHCVPFTPELWPDAQNHLRASRNLMGRLLEPITSLASGKLLTLPGGVCIL